MLNLFAHRQLLELTPNTITTTTTTSNHHQDNSPLVKLAVFGVLSPSLRENAAVHSRLVLYCDDGRLLLVQFTTTTTTDSPQQLWIPTDSAKGPIICMVLNVNATALLALTSQSYLYVIPFNFTLERDDDSPFIRPVLQEDARVFRCLALRSPTSLVWWQRPHAQRQASIALVGNSFGQLVFIDLETSIEFKLFTFPFGIDRLSIFEELYCQTLLISCSNKMQYQLTLEQFRTVINKLNRKNSTTSTTSSGSYLMACVMNFGGVGFEDDKEMGLDSMSSVLDSNDIKPQLISINEDSISPASTVTSGNQSEFFDLLEDSLKMSIHPQRHTRSVFVVKQNRPKYDFANISNNSRGEEAALSDSSDISATFCSVAVCRDLSLDVHEFRAEDFCTKTIILKDSKLFLVSMDADEPPRSVPPSSPAAHHQMLKIIDAGHRFFLLVYPTRIALVSKYFAEARQPYSASSPRSPLLLKKSDSLRSSGGGSFRRKNIHSNSGGGFGGSTSGTTVLEEFKATSDFNDEAIVDVFLVSTPTTGEPDLSALVHRDYPLPSGSSAGGSMTLVDLEAISRTEKAAIETKLSPKIGELIRIEEKWIVVTKRRCFEVAAKETDFGRYFHREVIQLLELVDEPGDSGAVDGDVITRAKYLVDAFVYRVCRFGGPAAGAFSSHPVQSWQFWLTRSALLLMESLTKSLPVGEEPPATEATEAKFSQIFRLFELARTPRRRVITALTYFRFWARALFYCRKFFESRVLQELTDEERLYLAHQMLDCLLERYRRAVALTSTEGGGGGGERANIAKKEAYEELVAFFRSYRTYFDVGRTLERLLDCGLWSMARQVAVAQSEYLTLLHLLLKKFAPNFETLPKETRSSVLDLLTSHRLTYTLILSTRFQLSAVMDSVSPPFPSPPSSPSPTSTSIRLVEQYLDFVIKALPNCSSTELYRLAAVLDPNRFEMQLLLNNVLEMANQTYLRGDSAPQVIDSYLPIRKRDLLHLYIFVLLLCMRKAHHHLRKSGQPARLYDWNFLGNVKSGFEDFKCAQGHSLKVDTEEDSVFCVSAGTFHSAAFESSRSNLLYIWGRFPYVKEAGGASLLTRHLRTPHRMNFFSTLLPRIIIREVACGHQHSLILTDAGLFALGSSAFGQLGLGGEVLEAKYPMTVACFQPGSNVKVVKIAAGSYHSLAISEEGQLWSWGYAIHGQLGHGIIEDERTPRRVDYWDYSTVKVVSVAAGYAHTIVLTNTGDVYVFGENSYNQLGIEMSEEHTPGSKAKFALPQQLSLGPKLPGRVKLVACGLFHTIALVTTGLESTTTTERLFCWGLDPKTWRVKMRADRSAGSKGSSMSTPVTNPATTTVAGQQAAVYEYAKVREISLEKVSGRVSKIVAGQSHSILLTDEGRCYTFGYGREGQLGLGSGIPSCPLVAEPILELEAIVDVAAGAAHSLAVNTEGTVWGWGQNADFQLDGCQPGAILDTGNGGGGNRRNSLLNSLMKRGDDQLMSRLMSLQKNVEWTPMRVQVPLLGTSKSKGKGSIASSPMPEPIEVSDQIARRCFTTKNRAVMIKQQLMECLVRYRHLLDFRSMLKRFTQFDYPQLSAVVSHFLNDPIATYLHQLAALKQEIQVELNSLPEDDLDKTTEALLSKCTQEVCLLTTFFANRNPRVAAADVFHLVNGLVKFAEEVAEMLSDPKFAAVLQLWSLKEILKRLYLEEDNWPTRSAYFGMAFFKVLQEREQVDEQFRQRWSLGDELLMRLIGRTQESLKECPSEMVTVQQLVEELVDAKDLRSGDAEEEKLLQFPLELAWRKIMQQFALGQSCPTPQKSADLNESDEIEFELPSDEEDDEDVVNFTEDKENYPFLLYVFACGHGLSRKQLAKHPLPKDPDYSEAIEKLLIDGNVNTIIDLLCPNCHSH